MMANRASNTGQVVIPKKVEIKEREVIEELLNRDSDIIDNNGKIVIVRFNLRNAISSGSWENRISIDTAVSEKLREYFRALENN